MKFLIKPLNFLNKNCEHNKFNNQIISLLSIYFSLFLFYTNSSTKLKIKNPKCTYQPKQWVRNDPSI